MQKSFHGVVISAAKPIRVCFEDLKTEYQLGSNPEVEQEALSQKKKYKKRDKVCIYSDVCGISHKPSVFIPDSLQSKDDEYLSYCQRFDDGLSDNLQYLLFYLLQEVSGFH